jgi:endonuclease YncB( thermonuclease family)
MKAHTVAFVVLVALFAIVVLSLINGSAQPIDGGDRSPAGVPEREPRPSTPDPDEDDETSAPAGGNEDGDKAAEDEARKQRVRRYLVAHVVDGDTLDLTNGARVRLVGIDTPETGDCHSDTATRRVEKLVLGKRVRLAESDEDQDRYGRLLRYVDIGDVDVGLRLIREGLAIARYDSRDGYGFHPREPRYVAADRRMSQRACAPEPHPSAQPPAAHLAALTTEVQEASR